jgi:glycosyltransferase involved in cell wall biosynthesis
MDTVRVTLLLPIRNGEKYLHTALANCETNASDNDEVLIIDDNSEDLTYELTKRWSIGKPRFRVLKNPGSGLVDALNFGIEQAKGDWIARFDVDDFYSNNRLEKQMNEISDGTAAIFSDYTFRTYDGRFMGEIRSAVLPFATELSILSSQRLAHPVALLNTLAVRKAGGYFKSEFPAEDLGLWLRLTEFGTFKCAPEQLLDYSISANSISGSKRTLMLETKDRILLNPQQIQKSIDQLNPTFFNIFKLYRHTNFYWERTLFFLRDLNLAKSKNFLTRRQSITVNIALIVMMINPFSLILVSKHYYFKRLRIRLREG